MKSIEPIIVKPAAEFPNESPEPAKEAADPEQEWGEPELEEWEPTASKEVDDWGGRDTGVQPVTDAKADKDDAEKPEKAEKKPAVDGQA